MANKKKKFNVYWFDNGKGYGNFGCIAEMKDEDGPYQMYSPDGVNFNFFDPNESTYFREYHKRTFMKGCDTAEEAETYINAKLRAIFDKCGDKVFDTAIPIARVVNDGDDVNYEGYVDDSAICRVI